MTKKIADIMVIAMTVTWIGYAGYMVWRDLKKKPSEIIISHSVSAPPDVVP